MQSKFRDNSFFAAIVGIICLALALFADDFLAPTKVQDELAVFHTLDAFVDNWNKGDLQGAMNIYQNSTYSKLVLESSVIRGYDDICRFWKEAYPDKSLMGKMTFMSVDVERLSPRLASAVGEWTLATPDGKNTGGVFTVLFQKTNWAGTWKAIVDHTTGL